MPFDAHTGRPPPVFYLADVTTRPFGHSLVSPSAPHIRWRRSAGSSSSTTTSLCEAGTWTAAELLALDVDPERALAVPAPLAARLALVRAGVATVLNHAHVWGVLEQAMLAEAA